MNFYIDVRRESTFVFVAILSSIFFQRLIHRPTLSDTNAVSALGTLLDDAACD